VGSVLQIARVFRHPTVQFRVRYSLTRVALGILEVVGRVRNECGVLFVYCSSHFAAGGKSVVDRAMAKAKKAAAAAPAASASDDAGERFQCSI